MHWSATRADYRFSRHRSQMSHSICPMKVGERVRQGDAISTKLSVITLAVGFGNLDWKESISLDGEPWAHLLFADDCVIYYEVDHFCWPLATYLANRDIEKSENMFLGHELNFAVSLECKSDRCRRPTWSGLDEIKLYLSTSACWIKTNAELLRSKVLPVVLYAALCPSTAKLSWKNWLRKR